MDEQCRYHYNDILYDDDGVEKPGYIVAVLDVDGLILDLVDCETGDVVETLGLDVETLASMLKKEGDE